MGTVNEGVDGERASSGKLMFIGEGVALLSVTALPGHQGFRGSVKRSRLGCYTGSSVWGRVKGFQGSRWQRSGCQGV